MWRPTSQDSAASQSRGVVRGDQRPGTAGADPPLPRRRVGTPAVANPRQAAPSDKHVT